MEHFSEQVWADFVREISAGASELASHLASGCRNCASDFEFWYRVQGMVVRERAYVPPLDAVRMVKLEFAATHAPASAEPITAKLIFDTWAQPVIAGVRSTTATPRQILYDANGIAVDLRFSGSSQPNRVHLIGQVLDKQTPRASVAKATVMLWTEKGLPIVETKTNEFGEFNLEFVEDDQLRLSIQVGRILIRIPLDNLKSKHDGDGCIDRSDVSNH